MGDVRNPLYFVRRFKERADGRAIFGRIYDETGLEIGIVTLEGGVGVRIPAGEYTASRYFSPDHGRTLWRLNDVEGRTEIEMHSGCLPRDTKGCLLVGLALGPVQYPDMDVEEDGITGAKAAERKWMTETQYADTLRLSISDIPQETKPGEFA